MPDKIRPGPRLVSYKPWDYERVKWVAPFGIDTKVAQIGQSSRLQSDEHGTERPYALVQIQPFVSAERRALRSRKRCKLVGQTIPTDASKRKLPTHTMGATDSQEPVGWMKQLPGRDSYHINPWVEAKYDTTQTPS